MLLSLGTLHYIATNKMKYLSVIKQQGVRRNKDLVSLLNSKVKDGFLSAVSEAVLRLMLLYLPP